ncbi:expressed unknown protein [Seminavis robusta]|uniref:Uncharacterized protein n=1 Tax=Seminavis robusta TaxID=568900 RepID=A0A9N8DX52_9STRA|nr:expressed unknown protein [Seminavis robusta]|eukprot:Sro420_g139270.1 n/a (310) ;mRNA; f:22858-24014
MRRFPCHLLKALIWLCPVLVSQAQLQDGNHYHLLRGSSRSLQESTNEQDNNAKMLNSLLRLALPTVNDEIRQQAPDPFSTDQTGTYNIGSSRIPLWCKSASFDFDYTVGEIVGLSDMYIESMSVLPFSVGLDPGLIRTDWMGSFMAKVATPSMIMANDLHGTLKATCPENGNERTLSLSGAMVAVAPTLEGRMDLAGRLCGAGTMAFQNASIPNPMDVGYDNIITSIDESPSWLPSFLLESLVGYFAEVYKQDLIDFVEPRMRPAIESSLVETAFSSPTDLIPMNLGFMRSSVEHGIERLFGLDGEEDP